MYIALITVGIVSVYFFAYRNTRTYLLREKVNKMCYKWNTKKIESGVFIGSGAYKWAYDMLPDYESMIFSFKSFRLESWLSEDIIKRLNNPNNEL